MNGPIALENCLSVSDELKHTDNLWHSNLILGINPRKTKPQLQTNLYKNAYAVWFNLHQVQNQFKLMYDYRMQTVVTSGGGTGMGTRELSGVMEMFLYWSRWRLTGMHACMLSRFSHVRLCATAAHQAPLSLGFSRQEYAISFSKTCMHAKSLQSCPTLCDPTDSSPPGSSVHQIL